MFVYLLCVQWFKVRDDCLFIFYMFNDLRSEVIVCLSFMCSMIQGQRWLFVYLLYVQWFKVRDDCLFIFYMFNDSRSDCLFIFYMFNDLRSEVIVCLSFMCSMIQGQRWLFVYLLYVQWFKVRDDCLFIFYLRDDCLFIFYVFNDLRSEVIVCLSFMCLMI